MNLSNIKLKIRINKIQPIYLLMWCWMFLIIFQSSLWGNDPSRAGIIFKIILLFRVAFVIDVLYRSIRNKLKKAFFAQLALFSGITILEYLFSNNWMLFDSFFVALFMSERLEYRKILKVYLSATLTAFCIILFLSSVGVFPTYNYISNRIIGTRISLGFRHPTILGETVLIIMIQVFLRYYDRNKIKVSLLMVGAAFFLIVFPNSLASAFAIIGVLLFRIIFELICKKRPWYNCRKIIFISIIIVFLICIIGSYVLLINNSMDGMSIFSNYDTLMSRINMGRLAFSKYGITFFGSEYTAVGSSSISAFDAKANSYFSIDCMYYNLPIRYGLIGTIVFFAIIFNLFKKSIHDRDINVISVIGTLLIYSLPCAGLSVIGLNFLYICQSSKKLEEKYTLPNNKEKVHLLNIQEN